MVGIATPRGALDRRLLKRLDTRLLAVVGVLCGAGLLAVNSATPGGMHSVFYKQIVWLVLSVVPLVLMAAIDPHTWAKRWIWVYALNVVLLGIVDLGGHSAKGAQRWIPLPGGFQFQPSEFAKLFMILTLAHLFTRMGDEVKTGWGITKTLIHIAIPAALIFKQPDLGTAAVIFIIWFGMAFVAGAKWQHLAMIVVIGLISFGGAWHFGIIKDYQKNRLVSFINPDLDPKATGYHIRQARIAVGSGQALGKGYSLGTQKKGHFIPEQHTDFIFAVIAEEGGLAAAALLLAAFGFLLWRIWLIIAGAVDPYYQLLAAGIFMMFIFHVTVNIGMTIGLAPVVGVPLPFISYGGSIMLVAMALIGLLLGIRGREEQLVF
jgi:rod shape determining protein RodA